MDSCEDTAPLCGPGAIYLVIEIHTNKQMIDTAYLDKGRVSDTLGTV